MTMKKIIILLSGFVFLFILTSAISVNQKSTLDKKEYAKSWQLGYKCPNCGNEEYCNCGEGRDCFQMPIFCSDCSYQIREQDLKSYRCYTL